MPQLSRARIFALVALLGVLFGVGSFLATGTSMAGIWGQLFWLTIGVLATSFLLETVLNRDRERRIRAEDGFAFRTFSGSMMDRLLQMSKRARPVERSMVIAAISPADVFAKAAAEV